MGWDEHPEIEFLSSGVSRIVVSNTFTQEWEMTPYFELAEKYGIDSNKGYGSKKHMDGIKQYGITKWHRRTFGICKAYEC